MSTKKLPPPPGFRMRQVPKASGGFRRVYPYAREKRYRTLEGWQMDHGLLHSYTEGYWRQKAQKMHAAMLRHVRERLRQATAAYKALPEDWRWKRDDMELRKIFQQVEDEYFREVRFRAPLECVKDHLIWGAGPYFMKLDIEDAFDSVSYKNFIQFVNDDWMRWTDGHPREIPLAGRIYHGWPFFHRGDGGLIQGAPTSPYLFERYCLISGLDDWLRTYAWSRGYTITRYVDDIVISSRQPFGVRVKRTIREAFLEEWGFRLNENKCMKVDTRRSPMEFLGVSLYQNAVTPNRKFWRGVEKHGMTKGRKRWLDQVLALNELVMVPETKKKRRAA